MTPMEQLRVMESLRLRGRVLIMLAEYAVSPFNDGTLFASEATLSNALGYPVEEIRETCQNLATGALIESEFPMPVDGPAWRINLRTMEARIRARQDHDAAEIIARGWGLLP